MSDGSTPDCSNKSLINHAKSVHSSSIFKEFVSVAERVPISFIIGVFDVLLSKGIKSRLETRSNDDAHGTKEKPSVCCANGYVLCSRERAQAFLKASVVASVRRSSDPDTIFAQTYLSSIAARNAVNNQAHASVIGSHLFSIAK
jgi:hypothetical protein